MSHIKPEKQTAEARGSSEEEEEETQRKRRNENVNENEEKPKPSEKLNFDIFTASWTKCVAARSFKFY